MNELSRKSVAWLVLTTVVMQAAAWCVLVYLFQVRRFGYGFFDVSDISVYREFAESFARGRVPYRDIPVEYPPLAIPLMVLPTKLGRLGGYDWVFAVEMMVFCAGAAVATTLAAARLWPGRKAALGAMAACTAGVLLSGPIIANRFDVVVALDVALFAYFLARRWWWSAAAALGLGFALKLTPAMFLPLSFLLAARRRAVLHSAVAFVVAAVLPFLPYLAGGARGLLYVLTFHGRRPLQIESLLASGHLLAHAAGLGRLTVTNSYGSQGVLGPGTTVLASLSPGLLLAGIAFLYVLVWRRRQHLRDCPADVPLVLLAMVLVLVCTSKVLSPQFLVWTLPLVALVMAGGGRGRIALGLGLLGVTLLTQVGFPRYYWDLVALHRGPIVLLIVRNLALLAVSVAAVLAVRRLPRTKKQARPLPDAPAASLPEAG